jgi:hypothetical protein
MPPRWPPRERAALARLRSPQAIQRYLNALDYSDQPVYRCPRRAVRDRAAHCVDGALLAAAALRRLGHRPLITWITAENDDGHMLALFRENRAAGRWGALAKSNFVTLRYREPVYASLRELVMSYFDGYFNTLGQRTMRGFTKPWDLSRFDRLNWETSDEHLDHLLDVKLEQVPVTLVITPAQARRLTVADPRLVKSGLIGAKPSGLYTPKR